MWLVVSQHSAFEITCIEFESYHDAKVYFDEWSKEEFSPWKIFLTEIKERK